MRIVYDRDKAATPPDEYSGADTSRPLPVTDQMGIQEFCRVLWRRIWVIVGSVVFFMAVGGAVVFSLVPEYTASALVQIKTDQSRVADFEAKGGISVRPVDTAGGVSEIQVLRSRKLA